MNLVERILTPLDDGNWFPGCLLSAFHFRGRILWIFGKKVVGCICMDLFDNQLTALHIVGHSWKRLYSTVVVVGSWESKRKKNNCKRYSAKFDWNRLVYIVSLKYGYLILIIHLLAVDSFYIFYDISYP